MKKYKHILLGAVLAICLICTVGFYDSDTFSDNTYEYYGNDRDCSTRYDASNNEYEFNLNTGNSVAVTLAGQKDDMAGFYVNCTVPTGQQSWGGIYSDVTIAGTTDGVVAALSGICWTDSSSAPTSILCGLKAGVTDSGADLSGCTVVGLYVENLLAASGNDPAAHYMMRFNTSQGAETPDYWFQAANQEAVAYTANTTHTSASTDKVGAIKCAIVGVGDCYLYVYSSAGQ